jgi:NTP pyrophosphatase (non-canonical NTP hydrolase)
MNFNEYQKLALRTFNTKNKDQMTLNGIMGICGEGGECLDLMKKHMFQGHELSKDKLKDELGDIMWYLAITAESLNLEFDEIAQFNINKLKTRYPNGFSVSDSIARVDYNKK